MKRGKEEVVRRERGERCPTAFNALGKFSHGHSHPPEIPAQNWETN